MRILVTGGTGRVGSEVIKALLKHNVSVRALVRKQEASTTMPEGIEVSLGDLLDPVAIRKSLDGIDKLYLLNAVVPDELTQGLIAYDLAKKLKLKQIVYHSVFKAEEFKDVPHFAAKLAIENALHQFNLPFTIIRPNYFFQNDVSLKDALMNAGMYPMPLGTPGVSAVDTRDIAEAAAIALTSDGHLGKTYNLNGPEILSGKKVASIWSRLLGKEIGYPGEDLDSFEEQMRKSAPSWSAFDIRMMFQGYLERGFVAEDADVETLARLLGHPLRRYEDFAKETVEAWRRVEALASINPLPENTGQFRESVTPSTHFDQNPWVLSANLLTTVDFRFARHPIRISDWRIDPSKHSSLNLLDACAPSAWCGRIRLPGDDLSPWKILCPLILQHLRRLFSKRLTPSVRRNWTRFLMESSNSTSRHGAPI